MGIGRLLVRVSSLAWMYSAVIAASGNAYGQSQTGGPHAPGDYIKTAKARLWYEAEGSGDPVVLISGGPGDSHAIYHPFFSRFADHHRLIYYDPFGVGKSEKATDKKDYRFARDVEDLEAVRNELGLPSITLIGHSYGSIVAQAYALKYPKAVKRLVLIGPFHGGAMWQENDDNANREIRNQYPDVWEKLMDLRAHGIRSDDIAHQDAYFGIGLGLFYFFDAAKAALLPHDSGNPDVYYSIAGKDAEFKIGGDIAKIDFRPELRKLQMPILILAGRYDRISMPKNVVEYRKLTPGARIVFLEHSGHFPYIEEPDETAAVLREFLEEPLKRTRTDAGNLP
ncbi:MAG: alpha/beta fold hydrolase [Bryobacteraceae bacterium]